MKPEDLHEACHVFIVHPRGCEVTFLWMHSARRERAHNRIQSDSFNQHARGILQEEITSYHSIDMKLIYFFFTLLIIGGSVAWIGGILVFGCFSKIIGYMGFIRRPWKCEVSPFHHPFRVGKCPVPSPRLRTVWSFF